MALVWTIDYEALSAWSTAAAAVATFGAIAVALVQSARARADLMNQLAHQNWLEQKRLEEQHLVRVLELVEYPYAASQEFYFSLLRLLGPVALGLPTPDGFDDEVRRELDVFAKRGSHADKRIGGFLHIFLAFREYHQQRGDAKGAGEYAALVEEIKDALDAGGRLREWLADPNIVLATNPERYFDLPQVVDAREKANAACRTATRRLVRLYENPPSAG